MQSPRFCLFLGVLIDSDEEIDEEDLNYLRAQCVMIAEEEAASISGLRWQTEADGEALKCFEKYLDEHQGDENEDVHSEVVERIGSLYYDQEDFESALKYFERLSQTQINEKQLNFRMAMCYAHKCEWHSRLSQTLNEHPELENTEYVRKMCNHDDDDTAPPKKKRRLC